MVAQAEPGKSTFDTLKLASSIGLVIAGIVAFYYFSNYSMLYRVLGILVLAGLSVAILYTTELGKMIWGFLLESKSEVRRVVWPTRQETMQATLMVVALVFIVGLILWVLDMILFWGVGILTGQKV